MSKQRYISTSFWDDSWVRALDPSEKFIYLYLMTNTLTNIAGVYEITIERICFDTGYNKKTVETILKRYKEMKKVYRWKDYIILPTWPKHQRWEQRSKIKQGIVSILKTLDVKLLSYLVHVNYLYPIDTLSIPHVYESNYSDIDIDLDLDSDLDSDIDSDDSKKSDDHNKSKEIILYLNNKTGKNYKHSTPTTKLLINTRMKEGFVVDDFKKVIDIKVADWAGSQEYSKYLRPETLFSNKFEGYLQSSINQPKIKTTRQIIEEMKASGEIL